MPPNGRWLLTMNEELRPLGIYNWTLPAWVIERRDGTKFNVCPHAGVCADVCYARNGTYLFRPVREAHLRNLELTETADFVPMMIAELSHKRYRNRAIRIHDAGDFYNEAYARKWLEIARRFPGHINDDRVTVTGNFFYAYTKEIALFKGPLADAHPKPNLVVIYSKGGKQDHLIDDDVDRHADVFPTLEAMQAAGYTNQESNDILAATMANHRVGIPVNPIKRFVKKQGDRTFGGMQDDRRARVEANKRIHEKTEEVEVR